MNSSQTATNSSIVCISVLFATDAYTVALNVIRILVSFFYVLWLILVFTIKEFRVKQMAFLHNLNLIGILYCITGLSYLFYTNCTELSDFICNIQAFNSMFVTVLSGYGLAALALYRLSCHCTPKLSTILSCTWLTISIGSVWILSIIFSLIQAFAFGKPLRYIKAYKLCLADSSKDIIPYLFFVTVVLILPNIVIIIAYIVSVRKTRQRKGKARIKTQTHSLRITVQLVVYIIAYELNCILTVITFYQQIMMVSIMPADFVQLTRILR